MKFRFSFLFLLFFFLMSGSGCSDDDAAVVSSLPGSVSSLPGSAASSAESVSSLPGSAASSSESVSSLPGSAASSADSVSSLPGSAASSSDSVSSLPGSAASSAESVSSSQSSAVSSAESVSSSQSSFASSVASSLSSADSSVVSSAPALTGQRVVISEVAWAGTDVSIYDEWIELYNNSSEPVDLSGWMISGAVNVSLSGTIPANGYYLLERTDDSAVPGLAADLIYSGSLANTGPIVLAVVDNTGATNDLIDLPSGWAAGSNTPKITMERIDTTASGSNPLNWRNGSGDVEGAQNSGNGSVSSSPAPVDGKITIASFNIQIFGTTKTGRPNTLNTLAMIATNFDILAVQEVGSNNVPSDSTATTVMDTYISKINEHAGPGVYAYVRGNQYAYVYRTDKVVCHAFQLYADSNAFAYTPLLAKFSTVQGNFTFSMITVHTSPGIANSEIPKLVQVIADVQTLYGNRDVICTGDFNADGSYYDDGGDAQGWLNGFDPGTYITAIPNTADTTVSVNNNFTYDRMQLTMSLTEDFTGNWGVFPMGQHYDVTVCEGTTTTDGTEAALSDHYPVWSEYYIGRDTD